MTLVGAALTTVSALLFFILFLLDSIELLRNPYIGLLAYLALPLIFVVGLLLIPIGRWRSRRRKARGESDEWPRVDLNRARTRWTVVIVALLTAVNVVIVSMASYGAVRYMNTPQFCGAVCHTVMRALSMTLRHQSRVN